MANNESNIQPHSPPEKYLAQHNPPSLPNSPSQPTTKRAKTEEASSTIESAMASDPAFADTNKPLPEAPPIDPMQDPYLATASTLLSQDAILSTAIPLQVKLLKPEAKAPTRGSKFSAGYDVYVCEAGVIPARGKAMLGTGISIACPPGTYARIAPRSGLAAKHSLQTGAGVIDYDYRGEVKILLFNHSDTDFKVEAGDRMAQMVLERIVNPDILLMEELPDTERGAGGFGSTGGFGIPLGSLPPLDQVADPTKGPQ